MTLDSRKFLSLLLIPGIIILIAIFLVLNISTSFNPPILLLVFNSLFLGLIPLYAAYIAYKSFRASDSNGVLLKGTGMLMIGLGAIIAGIINYLPNSMNANVTVQNTGFCIGAFLQLIGILIALSGTIPRQRRGDISKISILYIGCVLGFSLFSIAAVLGAVPPFFIQGIGFTALREFIITSAIEFFILSAGILLWLYYKKHEDFFFWYSIGMALIGLGLFAVHFPSVLGSPLGWIGRSAQYIGGVYLLIAFISLNISAHRTGIEVSEMLSRFFGESETNYKTLIDTATNAIVVFDSDERVIVWNRAAEKMFGYPYGETIGSSFFKLVIPDEFTEIIKNSFRNPEHPETGALAPKSVEISARRKDGNLFPMEIACSWNAVAGTWISTCILRDLTERKRTEASLLRLSSFPEKNTNPIVEIDIGGQILYNNPSAVQLFPDLQMNNHPFLANLESTFTELIQGTTNLTVREVWVDDRCYQQSIHYLPEIQRVRIYGMDITGLKKAEFELRLERDNLNALNEELSSIQEEMRHNLEEITRSEAIQRRQADLLRLSYDAIIVWRLDGGIESWNRGAELLYGYTEDEVRGKITHKLLATVHPKPWDQIEKEMREKGMWEGKLRHRTEDGREIIVNSRHQLIQDSDGVDLVLETNRDITDLKKAEEALRETRAKLDAALDSMTDAVFISDTEGSFIQFNDAFATFHKFRNRDECATTLAEYPEFLDVYMADGTLAPLNMWAVPRALRGESATNVEYRLKRKDTGESWVGSYSFGPIRDKNGSIVGSVVVGRDITDIKKVEEALQNNIRLLEDVMEGSPSPIFLKDLEGKFISINSALERMLGKSRQELKGKTDYDIAPKELAEYWRYHDRKVIDTGKAIQIEEVADLPDRQYIFLANKFPLVDIHGQIYGVGAISHDITERKKAENEVIRKNAELNEINEELTASEEELHQNVEELALREKELQTALAEKEVLLSEIHHRVKNNLTAFISLLSLDGSYEDTESGRTLRKDLQNRARSMALIHETLYRTGKFSNVNMSIYLKNLVDQIAQSYGTRSDIKIFVEVDGTLSIDRATTAGLIINELVTNSFKYAFPPGFDCMAVRGIPCTIRVTLAKEDGMDVLRVSDNGCGFREGFDPHTSKSLGLKLVNFLSRHQLMADVSIRRDKGTEFIFHLKNTENNP
jgi:PAS domain S-box-containing protein